MASTTRAIELADRAIAIAERLGETAITLDTLVTKGTIGRRPPRAGGHGDPARRRPPGRDPRLRDDRAPGPEQRDAQARVHRCDGRGRGRRWASSWPAGSVIATLRLWSGRPGSTTTWATGTASCRMLAELDHDDLPVTVDLERTGSGWTSRRRVPTASRWRRRAPAPRPISPRSRTSSTSATL